MRKAAQESRRGTKAQEPDLLNENELYASASGMSFQVRYLLVTYRVVSSCHSAFSICACFVKFFFFLSNISQGI